MDAGLTIEALDPHDDRGLDEWHEVERLALRDDRPDAVLGSPSHRAETLRNPTPYFTRTLLAARERGRTVGIAELGFGLRENRHLGTLEIYVLPSDRRRGVGRALYDDARGRCATEGRTAIVGEAHTTPTSDGAVRFARALGFTKAHVEEHLVLPLPVSSELHERGAQRVAAAPGATAYEIVTWRDRCPDDYLAGYSAMRTQMSQDVPLGDLDWERAPVDEERIRAGEELTHRSFSSVVAAARRRVDDAFCGYSLVYLPHGSTEVLQDDTLVMPEARGHRLGLALKLATLAILQREHPERTALHTWTAPDNAPMQRTNRALGFEPVELLHEMHRPVADVT